MTMMCCLERGKERVPKSIDWDLGDPNGVDGFSFTTTHTLRFPAMVAMIAWVVNIVLFFGEPGVTL